MNYFERIVDKIKIYAFSIMKETMNQFMCSSLIYKIFVFLETMQLVNNYT